MDNFFTKAQQKKFLTKNNLNDPISPTVGDISMASIFKKLSSYSVDYRSDALRFSGISEENIVKYIKKYHCCESVFMLPVYFYIEFHGLVSRI